MIWFDIIKGHEPKNYPHIQGYIESGTTRKPIFTSKVKGEKVLSYIDFKRGNDGGMYFRGWDIPNKIREKLWEVTHDDKNWDYDNYDPYGEDTGTVKELEWIGPTGNFLNTSIGPNKYFFGIDEYGEIYRGGASKEYTKTGEKVTPPKVERERDRDVV